jgi:hypothetical protein
MRSNHHRTVFPLLSLLCLGLLLAALPALAQPASQCQTQPLCKATAQGSSVQLASLFGPRISIAGNPDPILRSFIGDCCPGNNAANCPLPCPNDPHCLDHWFIHCGSPQCETGEFSCLYTPR